MQEALTTSAEAHYIDASRIFAKINRQSMHQVDLGGNCQVYLMRVSLLNDSDGASGSFAITADIETAPHNYVTRNAVKAWHNARVEMLGRADTKLSDLSAYARNLRFKLDTSDNSDGQPAELVAGTVDQSSFVNYAQVDDSSSTALTGANLADHYELTLLGTHVTSSTDPTTMYTTVGINKSWLDKRRKPFDAGADAGAASAGTDDLVTIQAPENPLLEIMAGSAIAEELAEEIQDEQYQEPPWTDSDHYALMSAGFLSANTNMSDSCIVAAPAGLFKITLNAGATSTCRLMFELIDTYDL